MFSMGGVHMCDGPNTLHGWRLSLARVSLFMAPLLLTALAAHFSHLQLQHRNFVVEVYCAKHTAAAPAQKSHLCSKSCARSTLPQLQLENRTFVVQVLCAKYTSAAPAQKSQLCSTSAACEKPTAYLKGPWVSLHNLKGIAPGVAPAAGFLPKGCLHTG